MEASPDGILVVDPNRRITSYNQRFADIWNIPLASLAAGRDDIVLEQSMSQVKDPRKAGALIQQLYENPGKTAHDELEMTDGRFIERHSVTLNTAAGEYLGRVWFFGMSLAVSRRRRRPCGWRALTGSPGSPTVVFSS